MNTKNTKKNKNGDKVTSLRVKKGQTLEITLPTVNWADFEKDSAESVVTGYNKVSKPILSFSSFQFRYKFAQFKIFFPPLHRIVRV